MAACGTSISKMLTLLKCDTDKQTRALWLFCGVQCAESKKVSFAPWNLFTGMGTSKKSAYVPAKWWTIDHVLSDQHQWSHDVAYTSALFKRGQTKSWSLAILLLHALRFQLCAHVVTFMYFITEFTSPQANCGL